MGTVWDIIKKLEEEAPADPAALAIERTEAASFIRHLLAERAELANTLGKIATASTVGMGLSSRSPPNWREELKHLQLSARDVLMMVTESALRARTSSEGRGDDR